VKRVLITGIQGFTGHYVSQEFCRANWEVHGFGQKSADLPNYYVANLLSLQELEDVIERVQPHAVVHLAGIAFAAHKTAIDFYNTHVLGTLNLLTALANKAINLEKILLASSANVYGSSASGIYDENSPLKPFNDYGVSKLAMEYMAWLWREKLPIVIARPFNYTGVGQSANFLIPKIVLHYQNSCSNIELGNLHVKRDYSDVRDIAHVYRKLVECSSSKGAINVCSGVAYSVMDILQEMKYLTKREITVKINPAFVRSNEVEILYGNKAKLENTIGPVFGRPLQETLSWMLTQP
jgi:nucleoside-diphosphate-sugar epimerase